MPFGGNDWLALTQEPALEPEIPIIDPHHHLWDKRLARIPYQRYLLDELLSDIQSGHDVRATVFIETQAMYRAEGPEEMRPVGEVEFVQGVAAASASGLYGPARVAAGIVGHVNMSLGERVEPVLEALQSASPDRFRGIRHLVMWDPHPEVIVTRTGVTQGLLITDAFREAGKVLARMGLSFETWLFHPQLQELGAFARAVPDLTIVLNHIGGVLRIGPYASRDDEVVAEWRAGIAILAACPNVYVKLGGVGMRFSGFDWHARDVPIGSEELSAAFAPYLAYCIEQFGPARCMFESNFPVDKFSYSYMVLFNAFKRFSKGYSPSERAAMFYDTAVAVYRIEV